MTATTFQNRATERQKALLSKLTLSSAFTSREAEDTARWLNSRSATKQTASVLIDRALGRIKAKDDRVKASRKRQATRRQEQAKAQPRKRPTCPATGKPLTFDDMADLLYR